MKFRALKYGSPVAMYLIALVSFLSHGWPTWLPLIYAWIILPTCELLIQPDDSNLGAAEEELAGKDRSYDFLL